MAPCLLSTTLLLLLSFRVQANFDGYAEEFVLGFPPNQNIPMFITKRLYFTSRESTNITVNVSVGNDSPVEVVVEPGKSTEYVLDKLVTVESITDFNKGIHVLAEAGKKVAVSASSYTPGAAGSFTVLPCHEYSAISEYVYYAISSGGESDRYSNLLLVGSSNETKVTLTPSRSVVIPAQLTDTGIAVEVAPGSFYTFTLRRLQTFLIQNSKDLSGTKVVSDKPMAVISSHQCAKIPISVDFCDFIVEQVTPTLTWGKRHLARSFTSRSSNTQYRVVASNNETALNITCRNNSDHYATTVKLVEREVYFHQTTPNTTCSFISSKPVMVFQLSEGGKPENFGDPLAILVTPIEQYMSDLSTTIPVFSFHEDNGQAFLEIYSVLNDVSLQIDNHSLPSMEPVYSNSDIVGYVSTVPVASNTEYVTITSSGTVPFSVRYYGFSPSFDGLGHSYAALMDPIAVPWVSIVNNTTVNITEEVGSAALPIMVSGDAVSPVTVTVLQCNGSLLPSQYQVEPVTLVGDSGLNPVYREIIIHTSQDDIFEKDECLCLELSPVQNSNVFFNDNYRAQLCFFDDEAMTIELVRAVLEQDEVQMTFSASGYTGSVLLPLVFLPEIHYPDSSASNQTLSNFTMYYTFTPQLTEITYSVEASSEISWTSNTQMVVSLLTTDYDINFDPSTVILENHRPVSTEISPTSTPITFTITSFTTSATPGSGNLELKVSIWVFISCILSVTIVCTVIAVAVCCCLFFGLRYRKKGQVCEQPVTMLSMTSSRRCFSEGNLSPQHDQEKNTLQASPHLGRPYRNSYVLVSAPSLSLSNGRLSGATSQDSCRGSFDPLVRKSSSPVHSSTAV